MADDDDSQALVRGEDTGSGQASDGPRFTQKVAEAEGPYCGLVEGARRPPPGVSFLHIPAVATREKDERYLYEDTLSWAAIASELDKAAKSGRIRRELAARLSSTIKSGFKRQNVPRSWIDPNTGRPKAIISIPLLSGGHAISAVVYKIACELKYISDPRPVQTILEAWSVSERQWMNWRRDYYSQAKKFLEKFLLDYPDFLQSRERLKAKLLPKDTMQ
jgi:hypothetical protein